MAMVVTSQPLNRKERRNGVYWSAECDVCGFVAVGPAEDDVAWCGNCAIDDAAAEEPSEAAWRAAGIIDVPVSRERADRVSSFNRVRSSVRGRKHYRRQRG